MRGKRLRRRLTPALLGLWLLACGRTDTTTLAPPEATREAARPAPTGSAGAAPTSTSTGPGSAGSDARPSPRAGAAGAAPVVAAGGAPSASAVEAPRPAVAPGGAAPPAGSHGFRHAAPGRLIAIGDLHGDLAATRAALVLGGAIDASGRWIGGDLTLVQTGDQLDRGDDERAILDLFVQLPPAAASKGGQVIVLNGNHEVMNVQGDYRYVTPAGIGAFAGVRPRSPLARSAPPPFEERAAAFLPGGAYALELAQRDVIAVVGDSVFVHGGVLPEHVTYGIERINAEARAWMRSGTRQAPQSVASENAAIWVRDYSVDPVSTRACQMLGEVLEALKVKRMVVGHTVQSRGITSACEDRVYRIDVGLSRYYGDGPIQVLEIDKDKVRILSTPR